MSGYRSHTESEIQPEEQALERWRPLTLTLTPTGPVVSIAVNLRTLDFILSAADSLGERNMLKGAYCRLQEGVGRSEKQTGAAWVEAEDAWLRAQEEVLSARILDALEHGASVRELTAAISALPTGDE